MNWEAIGAVGEILGAFAVVVSLLYLATQIRQNSRIVKGSTVQSITQTQQSDLRCSGDYGEFFLKMIEEPESLTKLEAFKLGEWYTAAMMARQNEYIQFRQNLVDEHIWHGCLGIIQNILAIPWGRNWWENFDKSVFTPDFIEMVDSVADQENTFDYQDYVKNIHRKG